VRAAAPPVVAPSVPTVDPVGMLKFGWFNTLKASNRSVAATAGNEIVPNLVRRFRESSPEVVFSLRNILTTDQIQMLGAGSLDIGFLRLPIGEHPELEVIAVHREPFVVVTPLSHNLEKEKGSHSVGRCHP
jgi:DNA-binding transcriptional LysR family regulator